MTRPLHICHNPQVTNRPATRPAAFFDLDKTIIARSSTLALTSTLLAEGMLRRRTVLRSVYAQATYQLGSAGQTQSERLRHLLGGIIAGWDAARLADLAREQLGAKVAPQVFEEAAELIQSHRDAGRDVVIVSASSRELVEPIGAMLGADHCLATRMEVKDGRYTGGTDFFNYGPAKVEAMTALAQREGYDLTQSYGYSDSITDLPMLESVGYPAVVNPSRTLRRLAEERGWAVVRFAAPGPVRSENRRLALTAAAAFVGPMVVGAGLVITWHWFAARRQESAS
ncbi:MAG: HAD-IB family hydrolase [Bifidobacteriaceae bacterium]|jgi:HAD superfamily hydrolase (TIGR01490 family)|nr:HAD-IB family hydrolase [Bifidobacteriaceae bacterium]